MYFSHYLIENGATLVILVNYREYWLAAAQVTLIHFLTSRYRHSPIKAVSMD